MTTGETLICVYWSTAADDAKSIPVTDNKAVFDDELEAYKFLHGQVMTGKQGTPVCTWSIKREISK